MRRRSLVVASALSLSFVIIHVVRADDPDESPEDRKQRLAAVAAEEKLGRKPWSVDYTVNVSSSRSAVESGYTKSSARTEVHASGGGHETFFPERDATPDGFSIQGEMIKDSDGKGSYNEVDDDETSCSPGKSTRHATKSAGNMTCKAWFEIQPDPKLWKFSAGCDSSHAPLVDRRRDCDGRASNDDNPNDAAHFGDECTNDMPGAKLTKDANGYTVDCTIVQDYSKDSSGTLKVSGTRTVTLHGRIDFKPVGYYATLEPADDKAYKEWRPEGPKLDGSSPNGKPGNTLKVKLVLRDATTKKPVTDKPYEAALFLTSSRLPGVAMNYPPEKEVEKDDFDLFFDAKANPAGKVEGKDKQVFTLPKGKGGEVVTVTSHDWGAYGSLDANVKVEGAAVQVRALALGKDADRLAIPLDEDQNHIADGWEDTQGILGKKYPPTWDEDDSTNKHKGDGFSLFDEYRGFYLQKAASGKVANRAAPGDHVSLSPRQREVLVAINKSPNEQYAYAGANTFSEISNIKVWFVPDAKYLSPMGGEIRAEFPRRANFNTPITEKLDEPAGAVWVVIEDAAGDCGVTPGIDGIPEEAYQSPSFVKGILVSAVKCRNEINSEIDDALKKTDKWGPARAEQIQKALKKRGMDPAAFATQARARIAANVNELVQFAVTHELGHATGARHHGLDAIVKCDHGCDNDADCGAECPAFTETSKRQTSCSVAYKKGADPKKSNPAPPSESEDAPPGYNGKHSWYCYTGLNERYGGGAQDCPMRYWQVLDGEAMVKFELGEWNPAGGAPSGGKWAFCGENAPTMRTKETSAELMTP